MNKNLKITSFVFILLCPLVIPYGTVSVSLHRMEKSDVSSHRGIYGEVGIDGQISFSTAVHRLPALSAKAIVNSSVEKRLKVSFCRTRTGNKRDYLHHKVHPDVHSGYKADGDLSHLHLSSSRIRVSDPYLQVDALGNEPLFTTYAASIRRSRLYADKAYFMDYFSSDKPITYSSQYAGELSVIWRVNQIVVDKMRDFVKRPVVTASFPDMAILNYEPFEGLEVQEVFFVYSSGSAVISMSIRNTGDIPFQVSLFPLLYIPDDSLKIVRYSRENNGYFLSHYESPVRLHSNLYATAGYPVNFKDFLGCDADLNSYGGYAGKERRNFSLAIRLFNENESPVFRLNEKESGLVSLVALEKDLNIAPGQTVNVKFVRGSQSGTTSDSEMVADAESALKANLQKYVNEDVALFRSIPHIKFTDREKKLVYLSSFNLVRQCILPPEGKTKYNYYVFSRNPIWGWGHGHQVMHESLSMIPYAYVDWKSAEESQEIYVEQQEPDGLIPYRVGPRGPQTYPHGGVGTTSAPFFSWTNWEIYKLSRDKDFLRKVYESGKRYVDYIEKNRDKNHDGLFEWGPYGMIENVRDDWNVVFQLLAKSHTDTVDISNQLDCLDLSCQVANEIYYLKLMAHELGYSAEERNYSKKFDKLAGLINKYMWDPEDRFYYNISMNDHSFEYEGHSLKRKEIIGFLPLWARVASKKQAADLVKELTNKSAFWRKYGVPTVSAADSGYTPFVDCCCHWNGPVWLLWDYMVFDGLEHYGYKKIAKELSNKMLLAVVTQLKNNHHFWESYSPDFPIQASPSNYIWDSIMAKVLIQLNYK
ncbi:MAG: MGH1-like glycoside hydrolase domain-containing protein [Candidatus Kryptoniota bacterium]